MSGPPPPKAVPGPEGDDEDDEGRMDVQFIKGFADKIQRAPDELSGAPGASRPKIVIPKRGEKDFEPLQETVNLQEMMLQNSRQALFDALQGVRGVAGKSLSHALVTPSSPFPHLIVSRGHVLDTLGITVRRPDRDGKVVSRIELLPEEAIYLAERGSLQIWNGRDPVNDEEREVGIGAWCDEEFGIKGAMEMSVQEVFGAFMGKEALSWQRYQAYAYLKRLGYTVQRTRQFIPDHFLASRAEEVAETTGLATIWMAMRRAMCRLLAPILRALPALGRGLTQAGLGVRNLWSSNPLRSTLLGSWSGQTYSSIFTHLRFIPAGHTNPIPPAPTSIDAPSGSQYAPLDSNPYLPFFHVWKPVTAWSKAKWDRGSNAGLEQQRPDYAITAIESRNTPLPTLRQLDEIFRILPDEPKGPPRRVGPQYENRRPQTKREEKEATPLPWHQRLLPWLQPKPKEPYQNPMAAMRNGDRAIVVAVNDSGNSGWIRFGRSGFESFAMV